uniref:Acyl-coenzyme A thioesterase 13 n=1 Tax=Acrobeloides nanus TaxID=290746 RepID=A0A914CHR7_9BILA
MSTTNGLNGVHNVKHKDDAQNDYMHDLEETIKKLHNATNFNRVASKIKAVSASPTSIVVELEIDESHVNSKGTLHGGQTAALLDIITARAVGVTVKDTPMVSLELSCSYLLPVKVGESVLIEGIVLKTGRNIAFTEAEFRRKSDNALVAKGKHTIALLHHLKQQSTGEKVEQF